MSKHLERYRSLVQLKLTRVALLCAICIPHPPNELEVAYRTDSIQPGTVACLSQWQTATIQRPNTLNMHSFGNQDPPESE